MVYLQLGVIAPKWRWQGGELIVVSESFPPTYRPRINPIGKFCDHEFIKIHRLPKDAIIELATGLKDQSFRGPLHGGRQKRALLAVLVVGFVHHEYVKCMK